MNHSRISTRPHRSPLPFLAVLVAGGCGALPADDDRGDPPARTVQAFRAPPVCPTRDAVSFQVTRQRGDTCAAVAGWTVTELVRQAGGGAPAGLYCWYRADGGDGPPDFATLELTVGARPDCPLVTPQAPSVPSVPSALTGRVGATTLARMPADQLTAAMTGLPPSLPAAMGDIHVAVLDTTANGYDSPETDNYLHGRAVARTIARLACPDPLLQKSRDCADHIENRLALSYRLDDPLAADVQSDAVHGGFLGTRAELAEQIRQVLDGLEASPPDRRQIINLSLAWDPEADGLYPDDSRAALLLLLKRAACLGALTVAAAGNGARSGPMLPAAWEALPAPDALECGALGFCTRHPFGAGKASYRPLVYSVGATDATDRPLANLRHGTLPRLVAYGMDVDGGLSFPASASPPTFTGTSMSTAIASAAAAAVWGQLPDSDPHEVMDLVYNSGVDLPGRGGPEMDQRAAEVCLGPVPCYQLPIHRVSVCDAVTAAAMRASGGALVGGAVAISACATVPAHSAIDAPPAVFIPIVRRPGTIGLPGPLSSPGTLNTSRSCPAATCLPAGSPSAPPLEPWTRPQPERPSCPACRLTQPNSYGDSYLWGVTASTFVSASWALQLVITPLYYGVAQPEQAINLPNQAGPIVLNDWVRTVSLNSASARLEWSNPSFNRVLVSQSTAINVDTP